MNHVRAGDPHEDAPAYDHDPVPTGVCAVTGFVDIANVNGGPPAERSPGGVQHGLTIDPLLTVEDTIGEPPGSGTPTGHTADIVTRNLWNNPSHSHFVFQNTVIACVGLIFVEIFDPVDATGGNDGHYLDIWGVPPGPGTIQTPLVPVGTDHAHDEHHGSVNESAWSSSSDYVTAPGDNGPPDNKGNIKVAASIVGEDAEGWVKYSRVGTIVVAWGEFTAPAPSLPVNAFTTVLVFTPTAEPTNFLLNGVAVLYSV